MNDSQATTTRQTKYCAAIENILKEMGHATNLEILNELREKYPTLSATTVHRATMRLASRGKIAHAPPSKNGSLRYDANLQQHDHFTCSECGKLRDLDVKDKVKSIIEESMSDCNISGRLTISGICNYCHKEERTRI